MQDSTSALNVSSQFKSILSLLISMHLSACIVYLILNIHTCICVYLTSQHFYRNFSSSIIHIYLYSYFFLYHFLSLCSQIHKCYKILSMSIYLYIHLYPSINSLFPFTFLHLHLRSHQRYISIATSAQTSNLFIQHNINKSNYRGNPPFTKKDCYRTSHTPPPPSRPSPRPILPCECTFCSIYSREQNLPVQY